MLIAQPAHCNCIVVAETPAKMPALHIPLPSLRRTGPRPRFNSAARIRREPQMNADRRR